MNDNSTLQKLLSAFIAGDREQAQIAAKAALDDFIHDFIFPEEAGVSDLGTDTLGDEENIQDTTLPDESELGLDPELDDQVDFVPDTSLDNNPTLSGDPGLETEFAPLAHDENSIAEDFQQEHDSIDLELPGTDDSDATLGALGDEVGVTAADVSGVEEVPGSASGEGTNPAVVDVAIDPEQGDKVVSAVKMFFDDNTDFTFYTFAQDAEKVVDAIKALTGGVEGTEGDPTMSTDDLAAQLGESFRLL